MDILSNNDLARNQRIDKAARDRQKNELKKDPMSDPRIRGSWWTFFNPKTKKYEGPTVGESTLAYITQSPSMPKLIIHKEQ